MCYWCAADRNHPHDEPYRSTKHDNLYLPDLTALIIRFLCIMVYLSEVVIRWSIKFEGIQTLLQNKWVLFRFGGSCLLIIGTLQEFHDPQVVTSFYCLVPFMYITRRKSLRDMSRGVFLAFKESIPILIFLFFIILFFSFIGFLLFANVQTSDGTRSTFDSLAESWLTCLHSFSARGFAIYALDPYFTVRSTSALYFLCLSVVADLLCTALIIATGNRQFRMFSAKVFAEQLLARKVGVINLHRCLAGCNPTPTAPHENKKQDTRYPATAFLANNNLPVTLETWLRFTECVGASYSKAELQRILFEAECDPVTGMVDCAGVCRLCALLGSRFTITGDEASTVSLVIRRSDVTHAPNTMDHAVELLHMTSWKSHAAPSAPLTRTGAGRDVAVSVQFVQAIWLKLSTCFTLYYTKLQHTYVSPIVNFEVFIPSCKSGVSGLSINVMKAFEVIIRLLLIAQLVNISRPNGRRAMFTRLGYVLETFFWMEALLHSIDRGLLRYCREIGYGYMHIINVITLVLMIRIGKINEDQVNSSEFIVLVVLQSVRIIRFFKHLRDSKLFNSILPLLFRVVLLVTSVIYFFAVFAHNRFCNTLQESAAEGNDDIADQWVQYSNLLNFETFPLAMFTLFEISLLGNWSMVSVCMYIPH